jgi:hypothetical protein
LKPKIEQVNSRPQRVFTLSCMNEFDMPPAKSQGPILSIDQHAKSAFDACSITMKQCVLNWLSHNLSGLKYSTKVKQKSKFDEVFAFVTFGVDANSPVGHNAVSLPWSARPGL